MHQKPTTILFSISFVNTLSAIVVECEVILAGFVAVETHRILVKILFRVPLVWIKQAYVRNVQSNHDLLSLSMCLFCPLSEHDYAITR